MRILPILFRVGYTVIYFLISIVLDVMNTFFINKIFSLYRFETFTYTAHPISIEGYTYLQRMKYDCQADVGARELDCRRDQSEYL